MDRPVVPGGALAAYYLATPLFAVIDAGFGAPIRVAGIESPGVRWAYYAGLVALGFLCRARPSVAPWVGMGESAVNILLLILAVMLPIWSIPGEILSGGEVEGPFSRVSLANFVLSGGALVWSFHRNQAAALGARRRG
ncbi:MAG: hypothetical protein RJQ04_04235 [Longimicrobiales bacterium]